MRYFIELAYQGTAYHGWQIQPKQVSVQSTITNALALILRQPELEIVGCGRTDTGVHASQYFAHFDYDGEFPPGFTARLNKFLPPDIAIHRIFPVEEDQHARFGANYRAYEYHLCWQKNPFRQHTCYYYRPAPTLDQQAMQAAAQLLLEYEEFFPFCKTNSDAKTMRCELHRSEWEFGQESWIFHIAANRFLRGMVRLIVGMCLSVGEGKMDLATVRRALDEQQRLSRSLSVAPEGLFLSEVRYPFL
jgi:tRNA pseudouridine38-40 synthase